MEIELLGVIRLFTILNIFLIGCFYFLHKKYLSRVSIFSLLCLLALQGIITGEELIYLAVMIMFFLIPLICSPVLFLVKFFLMNKIERRHGESGIKVEFKPFEAYKYF